MAAAKPSVKFAASSSWRLLRRLLRTGTDEERGVALVEFAIIVPILMVLMICTIDLGLGLYRKMQVQNAAQAGAQYVIARGFNESAIVSAVENATTFSAISASPEPVQFCGCPSSTGVTAVACDTTCPGGALAGTYVTVSAQGTYKTLFPYPAIPESFTFVSQSTVRIQ